MCGGVRDFGEKAGERKGRAVRAAQQHFKKHFGKVNARSASEGEKREARGGEGEERLQPRQHLRWLRQSHLHDTYAFIKLINLIT